MKGFGKLFLIFYIIFTIIFVYFFGNMNFFGESGFHMSFEDFITILILWSPWPSLILAGLITFIRASIDAADKKS